jgi:hypothetical protein
MFRAGLMGECCEEGLPAIYDIVEITRVWDATTSF